jgi:hypothetical protein
LACRIGSVKAPGALWGQEGALFDKDHGALL